MKQSDIGLIGLGVMGENLALNMEKNGWQVSVWNRTVPGVEEGIVKHFMEGRGAGKNILGFDDLGAFINSLAAPRKVFIMVRAGDAVDQMIGQLTPLLSPGDILIDGGNSNYEDTNRRVEQAEKEGFLYIGTGVSGGEEGALNGASIMPGGSEAAWPAVKPILQSIAAKADDGTPCCDWIGGGGAGHFVKMVHNGIEYGDIQLICEAYFLMKNLLHLSNDEMANVFEDWNNGKLKSYLIEITFEILRFKDKWTDGELIDHILDAAGQKGMGKWSVIAAMELGMPLQLIAAAVFERNVSAQVELRKKAAHSYPRTDMQVVYNHNELLHEIFDALYASKLVSYAQGFNLIHNASAVYGWKLNPAAIARMWRGGCIIRSIFLNDIAKVFDREPDLENLLLSTFFMHEINTALPDWSKLVCTALKEELAVPGFSSALNYFYSLTTQRLPANLLQAQRDYFGAHTFERTDRPRGEFFHENWTGEGGDKSSGVYKA